jgi:hypothetical protein
MPFATVAALAIQETGGCERQAAKRNLFYECDHRQNAAALINRLSNECYWV